MPEAAATIEDRKRRLSPKPTTRRTLLNWREHMAFSQRDAAAALGCSHRALIGWEKGRHDVPAHIGLAMAAVARGIKPYGH